MASLRQIFTSIAVGAVISALTLAPSACGGKDSSSSSTTVATVNVVPTASSISVNQQQAYTANALDKDGNAVSGVTFTWTSSAPDVATIDSSGIATGKSGGTTQITATAENVTSSPASLRVFPAIASISISPASATIRVNETQQFTAKAKDVNGNDLTGVTFNWSISYSGVARIDPNGLVTGVSPGTAFVTASAGSVNSPTATVNVTQ
jgi:hypothetical protein